MEETEIKYRHTASVQCSPTKNKDIKLDIKKIIC